MFNNKRRHRKDMITMINGKFVLQEKYYEEVGASSSPLTTSNLPVKRNMGSQKNVSLEHSADS